jgi:hypothetical protein
MGRFIEENKRMIKVVNDIYSLQGDLNNPPKVFIDDIESCVYIQDYHTPYNEFYIKKNFDDLAQ